MSAKTSTRSLTQHYRHFSLTPRASYHTLTMRSPWFVNLSLLSNQMRGAIFNTSHS
ncbi:MAG: hypothetical protein KME52_10145 [Desmonostoc geniculatum HA4340-LM1]|nr:hypothetical protein [Desmonostoc geniculatum HA4340-LM1]